jgi:hypothetical protein
VFSAGEGNLNAIDNFHVARAQDEEPQMNVCIKDTIRDDWRILAF